MDPRAFLNLAQCLSRKLGDEAALRTSISRSYYALHNFLAQFIENNCFLLPKTGKKHQIVYYCLHSSGVSDIPLIAKHLDELLSDRNDADYELGLTKFQDERQAVFSFIKAQTAYNDFEKFVSDSNNRKELIKAIRDYKNKCPF